jgi:ubiquinone/menaquinone biosynthesis C-methylase UbiE
MVVWDEATCRRYAAGMEPIAAKDHHPAAGRIAGRVADLSPGGTLAEIASGPGHLLLELGRLLPQADLVAVDREPAMLSIVEERASRAGLRVRRVSCPAEALALPEASVDIAVAKNLLNCLPEADRRQAVIREMARILKPGGWAFVLDFDKEAPRLLAWLIGVYVRLAAGPAFARDFRAAHRRRLHPGAVQGWMQQAGLTAVARSRHGLTFQVEGRKPPAPAS